MKNRLLKIALGTFVLLGLMLGPSNFAKATSTYDQTDNSVNFDNIYGPSYAGYNNVPSNFTFSQMGFQVSLSNTSCTGQNLTLWIWDNNSRSGSPILTAYTVEPCGNTPQPINYTFSPLTITTGAMSWQLYLSSGGYPNHWYRNGSYTQPAAYSASSVNGRDMTDGGAGFYPYVIFNGTPPPITLGFQDNPPQTAGVVDIAYYKTYTYGGQCVNNGSNRLALIFGHSDGSIDNVVSPEGMPTYTGSYFIDCVNNHWSTDAAVGMDVTNAFILDSSTGFAGDVALDLNVSADGSPRSALSFDPVITHSPETNDFTDWLLNYDLDPNVTSTSTQICVDYGLSGNPTFTYQDCGYKFNPQTHKDITDTPFGSQDIPKTTVLPMGNYKAE